MSDFNFDQTDVSELSENQLVDVDGGFFPLIILGVTLLTASETATVFLVGVGIGAAVAQGQKH